MNFSICFSEVISVWKILEHLSPLKNAILAACALIEEPGSGGGKKEKVLELAHHLWEEIDPTPDLNLDDEIVEMLLDWIVDAIVEKMNSSIFTENSSLS